jgi:hypothetical protein
MTLEGFAAFVIGVLLGLYLGRKTTAKKAPPILIHEGDAPYRRRCQFMAVHECSCVLDAGHSVKHVCIHGSQWGAFDRPNRIVVGDEINPVEP